MRVYLVRFMDSSNVDWRVREEIEQPEGTLASETAWQRRRLRFESALGVRWLSPVPDDWEELSPQDLELLCSLATAHGRAA